MKFPPLIVALAMLSVSCASVLTTAPAPVLSADFDKDPNSFGWRYVRGRTPQNFQPWQADPGDANHHCIAVSAEPNDAWTFWDGPAFPVEAMSFYRVSLRYQAQNRAYVAVIFSDANGRELDADNYTGLDPADAWQMSEMTFMAKLGATKAKIRIRPEHPGSVTRVSQLAVTPSTAAAAREWIRSVGAAMPAFDYAPPASRGKLLPATMERLKNGPSLRVVMLGDSIINDTGNSLFPALLMADCPRTKIEVITSVRGGTGCSFYQGKDRAGAPLVQRYVLDYKPDLVIIGGISHNFDPNAIGAVIAQIQAATKAEILVATGAVALRKLQEENYSGGPNAPARYREKQKARIDAFPGRLQQICQEKNVEFWDTRADWDKCVAAIAKGDEWLMRDDTHANSRGWFVLSMMFEAYLKP